MLKIASHIQKFNFLEQKTDNLTEEELEKHQKAVCELSKFFEDDEILNDPTLMERYVQNLISKYTTINAKINSIKEEMKELDKKDLDENVKQDTVTKKIDSIAEENKTLLKLNEDLQAKIEDIRKSLPLDEKMNDMINKSKSMLLSSENSVVSKRSEIANLQNTITDYDILNKELLVKLSNARNELSLKEKQLSSSSNSEYDADIEQMENSKENIQNAIKALSIEKERKYSAKRVAAREKVRSLELKNQELIKEREQLLRDQENIIHIKNNINYIKNMMDNNSKNHFEDITETKNELPVEKINKERISRYILSLIARGNKAEIIEMLSEELNWNRRQKQTFTEAICETQAETIGDIWSDWLNDVTS